MCDGCRKNGLPPLFLTLEQQHALSGHFQEAHVLGLVCDGYREVVSDDAVPCGVGVGAVELLLDARRQVLLHFRFAERVAHGFHGGLLHLVGGGEQGARDREAAQSQWQRRNAVSNGSAAQLREIRPPESAAPGCSSLLSL